MRSRVTLTSLLCVLLLTGCATTCEYPSPPAQILRPPRDTPVIDDLTKPRREPERPGSPPT